MALGSGRRETGEREKKGCRAGRAARKGSFGGESDRRENPDPMCRKDKIRSQGASVCERIEGVRG